MFPPAAPLRSSPRSAAVTSRCNTASRPVGILASADLDDMVETLRASAFSEVLKSLRSALSLR
jgi:hypothetical protein